MALADQYRDQVMLLLQVLPHVAEEKCFALKGGTAINLFIRDLPRLSVDIDLTYLPVQPRTESLEATEQALSRIAKNIRAGIPHSTVVESKPDGTVTKLYVRLGNAQVKIEVTPVMRGVVYEPKLRSVSPAVEDTFGFAEIQIVSFADLYAGKIVAALDRQHPRDLFDVRDLLANEGINDELRRAFIVYMLSHSRPMHEVLDSPQKDITQVFEREFRGMTEDPVTLEELHVARKELVAKIVGEMPDAHRRFLISFEKGAPAWDLLGLPEAAQLPAVVWRQQNLDKLPQDKRTNLSTKLEGVLALSR